MNKDLERVIEIPEEVKVVISGNKFTINNGKKELIRNFDMGKVNAVVKDNSIILTAKGATRRESKMIGTIWAHLKNMIKGISEEFIYELEICNAHFPMNVKKEEDNIIIKSFLGETTKRISKVLPNVNVEIKGNKITIKSNDIEAAGQTAANLEKATKLTGRDRRIFQDGIYITNKCGRAI